MGVPGYASDLFNGFVRQAHVIFCDVRPSCFGTGEIFHHVYVEFRAGLAAAWLGAVNAVMLGGACILLVVALGRKAFPELYAVETLEPPRR